MTAMMEMPRVQECTAVECAYNQHEGCHAFAITIGTEADSASCTTFFDISSKGGLDAVIAQVGACKRADCRFNAELECRAPAIRVGPSRETADCMTYEPA
ncbi:MULTISPECIES: DUF1540 domain-containing protein [Micromonosporaceae]|mgnify:FL=1|uniref:DUF1540 domain-containing protein n=1 Tax=Micromonosporaceae TaxID=28056 RepID=UPI000F488F44|nr:MULTISPECIES: DUF1540 domain-containing protein [Micromonosporaceae]MDG4769587.1 DUF1540 domain-containing protein [Solwaraspora sp. WMMD792]ROO58549.1 uncharacterized protein DUF1540 [Micromonospora sp. Llam0]WBB98401.1 DUF1540 domain-containing protein [Solwaraspora sp. WMMA2059]WBC23046.1 DUF1540 domain-containing protein [Solwaraspora sp. WMMA2080]WFE24316.1 DUF1540 domain-containing protein [Solwaraspora sp. WMMD937]